MVTEIKIAKHCVDFCAVCVLFGPKARKRPPPRRSQTGTEEGAIFTPSENRRFLSDIPFWCSKHSK